MTNTTAAQPETRRETMATYMHQADYGYSTTEWEAVARESLPRGLRFEVPGQAQGQTVQRADGFFGATVKDPVPYVRVEDQSVPGTIYLRRR